MKQTPKFREILQESGIVFVLFLPFFPLFFLGLTTANIQLYILTPCLFLLQEPVPAPEAALRGGPSRPAPSPAAPRGFRGGCRQPGGLRPTAGPRSGAGGAEHPGPSPRV